MSKEKQIRNELKLMCDLIDVCYTNECILTTRTEIIEKLRKLEEEYANHGLHDIIKRTRYIIENMLLNGCTLADKGTGVELKECEGVKNQVKDTLDFALREVDNFY